MLQSNAGDVPLVVAARHRLQPAQKMRIVECISTDNFECACKALCVPTCLAQLARLFSQQDRGEFFQAFMATDCAITLAAPDMCVLFDIEAFRFVESKGRGVAFDKVKAHADVLLWSRFCREELVRRDQDAPYSKQGNTADAFYQAYLRWRTRIGASSKATGRNTFYAALEYLTGCVRDKATLKTEKGDYYPQLVLRREVSDKARR